MWSLKEIVEGLKVVVYHEIRAWLRVLKIGAYAIIWVGSFILIGNPLEVALDEHRQVSLLVTVTAATAITSLAIYVKNSVLMSTD